MLVVSQVQLKESQAAFRDDFFGPHNVLMLLLFD